MRLSREAPPREAAPRARRPLPTALAAAVTKAGVLVSPKVCFTEPLEAQRLGRKRARWSRRSRKHRPELRVDGHGAATAG